MSGRSARTRAGVDPQAAISWARRLGPAAAPASAKQEPGSSSARHSRVVRSACLKRAVAFVGGCCTKPFAKTWAALALTVAEGPRSAEAGQGAPRASDDLPLFRPRP